MPKARLTLERTQRGLKNMFSDDPKNVRRRKQRARKREQEARQRLDLWRQPVGQKDNRPGVEVPPPSIEQTLTIAGAQFDAYIVPFVQQWMPNIITYRPQFLEMVRQQYLGLHAPRALPLAQPLTPKTELPPQLPSDWRDSLKHPDHYGRVRASSMVVKIGMCGIRGYLEEIDQKRPRFGVDYKPNRAMREGTAAHQEMHKQERAAVASFTMAGYKVATSLDQFFDQKNNLVYLEEQELTTNFDYHGKIVPLTGTPDRIFSTGGDGPIFIAEGKTNLFESILVMGYLGQAITYDKLMEALLNEKAPQQVGKRRIFHMLTESRDPFTVDDLLPLAKGDSNAFLQQMRAYALMKKKVLVVQEYGFLERALAQGLIHTIIEARRHPRFLQGAASLDICNRYRCPWAQRNCDQYKHLGGRNLFNPSSHPE